MSYEKEIKALILKAERSLRAGQSLFTQGDYDFAISRAYYAMFYCAQALLLTKKLKFSKHSAVISSFGQEFVKPGVLPEELHTYFMKAFRERQKGDYEVVVFPSGAEAEDIIEESQVFLEETKEYLGKLGYEK